MSRLLFPPVCPICSEVLWKPEDTFLCEACRKETLFVLPPYCNRCGTPFKSNKGHECGQCLQSPPPYRYLRTPFGYQGELRNSILKFKMLRHISLAAPLAGLLLLTEQQGINWNEYDLICPIPLHHNRLKWRGFNQCALLIKEVARQRNIVCSDDVLLRIRDTTPQFMVNPNERSSNVKGAFVCNSEDVSDKKILLVDDITTTGSTIAECAKVLKKAGAFIVDVAVLARSVG